MSSGTGTVGNIEGIDIGVIVAYFVIVIGFGIWVSSVLIDTGLHFLQSPILPIRCRIVRLLKAVR